MNIRLLEKHFNEPLVKSTYHPLYYCLGFIVSIASSPKKILLNEWIKKLVLKKESSLLEKKEEIIIGLLSLFFKECNHCFSDGQVFHLFSTLTLTSLGKPNKKLISFSMGYLEAFDSIAEHWKHQLYNDDKNQALLILNLILARFMSEKTIAQKNPELLEQMPDLQGCLKMLPKLITGIGFLGHYLRKKYPKEKEEKNQSISSHHQPTLMNNEECFCGSQKPFNRCCLH
jgi:uncharacterized protein YecA (UPF0149 family)